MADIDLAARLAGHTLGDVKPLNATGRKALRQSLATSSSQTAPVARRLRQRFPSGNSVGRKADTDVAKSFVTSQQGRQRLADRGSALPNGKLPIGGPKQLLAAERRVHQLKTPKERAMGEALIARKKRQFGKGFVTQSTKPVLALRKGAAGSFIRPRRVPGPEPVAKVSFGEISRVVRMAPKAAGAGWKAGVKGGAKPRMALGTAVGMAKSPTLRGIGQAGKFASENRGAVGLGTGIVGGSVLGYSAHRDNVDKAFGGRVPRAKTYEEWSRIRGGLGPKTLRRAQQLTDKHGMTTPKGRRAFGVWQRDNNRKGSWVSPTGRMADGFHRNLDDTRWRSGVYDLNMKQQRKMRTAERLASEGKKVSPVKRRRGVALDLEQYEHPDEFTNRVQRGQFHKAYGDPEDARYYRMGAGSAALAGAGLAGVGHAAHDVRRSSKLARAGSPMGVHNLKNVALFAVDKDELDAVRGTRRQATARVLNPKLVHHADRLARGGLAITRRGALAGAGGLAALGGAEALRRRAHERRYS